MDVNVELVRFCTFTGNEISLVENVPGQFKPEDVAWALGRIVRYNGHIAADYTVAHHSLAMSHLVDEKYALDALLHDCAEAFIGDIISPVKALFPDIAVFEHKLMERVIRDLVPPEVVKKAFVFDNDGYVKRPVIKDADWQMYLHESAVLNRHGEFEVNEKIDKIFVELEERYHDDFLTYGQPWWAWLRRFHELTDTEYSFDKYSGIFFPNQKALNDEELEQQAAIEDALKDANEAARDAVMETLSEMDAGLVSDEEFAAVMEGRAREGGKE